MQIRLNTTGKTLWYYRLKKTGEEIAVKAPVFNIDGKDMASVPRHLNAISSPVTLSNGVTEYSYGGKLKEDTTLHLQLIFRISANSPVLRFRYILTASRDHYFTKKNGTDFLSYCSVGFNRLDKFSEIQLSDFNVMTHAYQLNDKQVSDRYFEDSNYVTGPILVAERKSSSFLLAYEHGSQIPDRFIQFQLSPNKEVSISAVKGNYYGNQLLNSTNPFETIWFEIAGASGSKQQLASHYRHFILKDIVVNQSSRKPYIYYNTWGFQERNKAWNNRTYLSSMNLNHMLKEIDVAHQLGVDVFVLDAGWFSKTGDWQVNTTFFPDTLHLIKAKLDSFKMKLGLWYSPTQGAVTSNIYKNNKTCITSFNGSPSIPNEVWETEPSYNMCIVSDYWKDCAAQMIRSAREYGNVYFKWDAISQYGCNDPNHHHGTAANTDQERLDCYAFELGRYLNKIVDTVSMAVPGAIVDFDVTEGWRSMGLQFLASGKYFIINNGPYYDSYNLPLPKKNTWNNIFVYPGSARAAICRSTLGYDQWIPSVLFLTHYLPDAPKTSQTVNVASLILGQNGFWGDLLDLSSESVSYIGNLIQKYKQVKDDITTSDPVMPGDLNSLPEIHEKINAATGRGVVVIFSMMAAGHQYTYITKNKVDKNSWHSDDVAISFDSKGRAIITCEFKKDEAKIIFFGVK